MTTAIAELDVVKVTTLLEADRQFTGSDGVKRAPSVGDLATVVNVLEPGTAFVVEAVDADGYTIWLADFCREELQLVVKYSARA
jgi:hypothetical protein